MGILYSKGKSFTGSVCDTSLSTVSNHPIANSAVATAINQINSDLTEQNLSGGIDLSSYTASFYTFPHDGYVELVAQNNASMYARLYGANEQVSVSLIASGTATYSNTLVVTVRKGMKLKKIDSAGTASIHFYSFA